MLFSHRAHAVIAMSEVCKECRLYLIVDDGLCQECFNELKDTWQKMDEWLMDNT